MIRFRAAIADDIPALHALIESAYRGESAKTGWTHEADLLGGQRTDPGVLAAIIADPAQTILVAEDDGDRVACVLVADRDGVGYLGLLTVRPARQRAGLGRRLLEEAERHAREAFGARRVAMTVIKQRRELIDWYLRRGYVETGREEPFPLDDPRFGEPKTRELVFIVLEKALHAGTG